MAAVKEFRSWPRLNRWLLLTLPLVAASVLGQIPEGGSFGSAVGVLVVDGARRPLAYTLTAQGTVVALEPIVAQLGGQLTVGPLQLSHSLDLYGERVILGPDSAVITLGERIVPLSRQPLAGIDGLLEVPLDFLEKTYGAFLGYDFRWSAASGTLTVERARRRLLAVELDMVQIAATTTLVLQFSERPRYRVAEAADTMDIVVLGDTLELAGRMPRADSLVQGVEVTQDRVRVRLAPGVEATEPYLLSRGSRTQLVIDLTRRQATAPRRALDFAGRDFSGFKIVLDPGHGGAESGAVGRRGSLEKDLTLELATALKRRLEASMPVRVILTRDADGSLDHDTRTAIANQNRADLFISLHLNSEPGGDGAQGAETYFLDQRPSDPRAAMSAEFENRGRSARDAENGDLELMLWDLAQSRHLAGSQRLANLVQEQLNLTLGLKNRGVKQAPFRVLIGATMPAILVELGFVSNDGEEARLLDPAYRLALVDALVEAVVRYRSSTADAEVGSVTRAPQGQRP